MCRNNPAIQIKYRDGKWQTHYLSGQANNEMTKDEILRHIAMNYYQLARAWALRNELLEWTGGECATLFIQEKQNREYLKQLEAAGLVVERSWKVPESVKAAWLTLLPNPQPLEELPLVVWKSTGEMIQIN